MPEDTEETALTLNGKKKNLRKKDFLALAQNMGIREKTACGLMNQLLNRTEVFRDIAEESCLSKELKEAMKHLIRTRTDVLA